MVTATLPSTATQIDEVYLDGQVKSQRGSSRVEQAFSYSVNGSSGNVTRQVNFGGSAYALVKTTADWLGRSVSEVKPGWNGSDVTRTWAYNSGGQLAKVTQPGMAPVFYGYDTVGTLVREYLDVNTNDALDMGSDRITAHSWAFFLSGSDWWKREVTTGYATSASAATTQLGKTETQISGFTSNRVGRTVSYDIYGNVTTSTVDMDRANKKVTSTVDIPDSTTDAVQIAYNGLITSSKDKAGNTTTFGYDALGRQITAADPRTGTTTTAYVANTSQVYTVTDPASTVQATYDYDSAGRVNYVMDALGKKAYTDYTPRNEVAHQWGDTVPPVYYEYDVWGHRTKMSTYRSATGLTATVWASVTPGTADVTQWNFQEATGLLSSKVSAYGTVDAKTVSYTYTQAGQISTRLWARILTGTTHLTTTYDYSSATGELTSVDYNDTTTDLAYTYNRLGNIATVADATGTRTLNYNLSGTLELQSEDLSAFFSSKRITYPAATTGVIGRSTGLQLGSSGSPTADQSITYGYDTYGRLNSFAGGSQTFSYGYATNSNLVATITNSAANYTDTRTYDSAHNWIDARETKISSATKAKFAYTQDTLGRITAVTKTGEVYNIYGNTTQGLDTAYDYTDRSELKSEGTKLGGSATDLDGRKDAYQYDTIGNRASTAGTTHNLRTANYTTNALNQYAQRTVPGYFDVAGALAGATVTVTKSGGPTDTAARQGAYFFDAYALTNTSNAAYDTLTVSDGTTSSTLPAFVAKDAEVFTYDDDGNLLSDGRWDYTYDAENRLMSVQTHTALSPSPLPNAHARRLEFKNDYLGRRVEKIVRSGWNGSTFATVASDEKFVYNGWNLMARLNAASSNAILASYYWGTDLSGSMQGAGGVGGLLLIQDSGSSYLPAYDGNGNIHGLIKASDGSLAAAYEYDAFGNTLREIGLYAASNPFRFSTKYTDLDTGLVYYGLRYYSPTLGRFINKDPIEEEGGVNLYGFCMNNGVNKWDYLGMDAESDYRNRMALDVPDEVRTMVRYMRNTFGQWSFPGVQYNADLNNVWVTAYSHEVDGYNGAADHMGIGSINDARTGATITMDQATSSLWKSADGSYFYGSDIQTGTGNENVVRNSNGQTVALLGDGSGQYTAVDPARVAVGREYTTSVTLRDLTFEETDVDIMGNGKLSQLPATDWDGVMNYKTKYPGFPDTRVPDSNEDKLRAIIEGFGQYRNALNTGATLGNAAPIVAVAPIVIAEAAPVLAAAAKDLRIDGPQRGSRLLQLRYRDTPLVRLDYGRYPGSRGEPRLHLNIGPGKESIHIPLDPRTWFKDEP